MNKVKYYILLLFFFLPLFIYAQASGGQIRRKSKVSSPISTKQKRIKLHSKLNGYHEKIYPDGSSYKGDYKDDLFDGYGELRYKNGDIYKGYFKYGKKEGMGVIIYSNDWLYLKYDGEFSNDMFNGKGTLYWKNGYIRHTGNFINNERKGEGTTYFDQHPKGTSAEDLLRCEGYFDGGHMIKGTIYYYTPNTQYLKYIGECDHSTGYPRGQGKMYYQDGRIYEGQFSFHPHGYGKMIYPNGEEYVGEFQNGAIKR